MQSARARTQQRRREATARAAVSQAQTRPLTIDEKVMHAICRGLYPKDGCACEARRKSSPEPAVCDSMKSIADRVIGLVTREIIEGLGGED